MNTCYLVRDCLLFRPVHAEPASPNLIRVLLPNYFHAEYVLKIYINRCPNNTTLLRWYRLLIFNIFIVFVCIIIVLPIVKIVWLQGLQLALN
jgi:hypothetical protein